MDTNVSEDQARLDNFLTTLESKLKNPFTSIEVKKLIKDQQHTEDLSRVFCKLNKAAKCRVLVGLLLMDKDEINSFVSVDNPRSSGMSLNIIEEVLKSDDEDDWVKVLAEIVQDKISSITQECVRVKSTAENIWKQIESSFASMEKDLQTVNDPLPQIAPYFYSLADPGGSPSENINPHFEVQWSASILSVDKELESKRGVPDVTEDNAKISDAKERKPNVTSSKSITIDSKQYRGGQKPIRQLGITKSGIRGPSKNAPMKRYGVAAGANGVKKSNIKALQERRKQQLKQNQEKNLSTASQRQASLGMNRVMRARARQEAHRTSAHRAANKFSGLSGSAGSRYQGAGSSKMRMIDVSDVKDLEEKKKVVTEERTDAETSSKKKRGVKTIGNGENKTTLKPGQADERSNGDGEPSRKKARSENEDFGEGSKTSIPTSNQQPSKFDDKDSYNANALSKNEGVPISAPQTVPAWHQLLEKSNKLSGIDRQRVKDFFTSQSNPTPGESIYKMKLHEEKIAQPDGSVIKETHYLELDYATMGFKKLRKTKKK